MAQTQDNAWDGRSVVCIRTRKEIYSTVQFNTSTQTPSQPHPPTHHPHITHPLSDIRPFSSHFSTSHTHHTPPLSSEEMLDGEVDVPCAAQIVKDVPPRDVRQDGRHCRHLRLQRRLPVAPALTPPKQPPTKTPSMSTLLPPSLASLASLPVAWRVGAGAPLRSARIPKRPRPSPAPWPPPTPRRPSTHSRPVPKTSLRSAPGSRNLTS